VERDTIRIISPLLLSRSSPGEWRCVHYESGFLEEVAQFPLHATTSVCLNGVIKHQGRAEREGENLQRRHRNGGESRLLVVQKQGGKRARGVVHPTKEAPPWILDVDTLGFLLGVVQPQFPIRILLNGSLDNHAVPPGYLTVPSTVVCSFGQSTVILVAVILVVARAICGGLTLYSGKPAASCCSRAFEHLAFGRTKKPQALRERK